MLSLFKLVNIQGLLGGLGCIALGVMLLIAKGDARHFEKQSARYEKLWRLERDAHRQTVVNYRLAAAEATRLDAANKARVEAEQRTINERTVDDLESRLAAARALAERLRGQRATAAADPRCASSAAVPGAGPAPGTTDCPAAEAGLSDADRLIATEQAIQLEALIKWTIEQSRVAVTGADADR